MEDFFKKYPLKSLHVIGDFSQNKKYYYQYVPMPVGNFHVFLSDNDKIVRKHTISNVSKLFDLNDGKFVFIIKNSIILTCIHLTIIDEKEYWEFYSSCGKENSPRLEITEMVTIEECESIIKKRLRCFNVSLKNGKKIHVTAVAFGNHFFIDA